VINLDDISGQLTQKEKRLKPFGSSPLKLLARLAGFEPAAYGLEVCPKLKTV